MVTNVTHLVLLTTLPSAGNHRPRRRRDVPAELLEEMQLKALGCSWRWVVVEMLEARPGKSWSWVDILEKLLHFNVA